MKQIRNIQVLRGLAAIAVILYHLGLWEEKAVGARAVCPGVFHLGEAGVDLFFVISGFIMAYIQPAPLSNIRLYGRFLVHRFTRIYPPLWIVMLPLWPLYLVHPELFNNFYHHRVEVMRSFLLVPQDYTPLLGVAWTLIHEVYFYLVVSLALIGGLAFRVCFGALWFLVVLAGFCAAGQGDFGGNRWLQLVFSPFSLTFLLGYFIGLWHTWRPLAHGWLGSLGVLLGLGGLALAHEFIPFSGVYPDNNYLFRFGYYAFPCAFLVLGAVLLENATRQRFATLRHLGNESYAIYLLHLPILTIFYKGVAATHRTGPFFLAAAASAAVLLCIACAALFHRYLEVSATTAARKYLETRLGLIDPRHPEAL